MGRRNDRIMSDMVYPPDGKIYLLSELNQRNANISDLIDACVAKDRKIAELEARLKQYEDRGPDPQPKAALPVTNGSAEPAVTGERT